MDQGLSTSPNSNIADLLYDKLLFCDVVCITTPNHIGKSTLNRINQSIQLGKDIIIYENDSIKEYIATK